jgi:hypothetical protein
MGLDRPFTAEDLDRIEEFYKSHAAPSQLDLCPLHDAEVFAMVKERGYSIAELNNVLYRKLHPEEKFPPVPPDCDIRRGTLEDADAASALVERAFFPDGAPEPYRGLLTALSRARMSAAAKAGCEYAVVVTQGGSASQRNCERLGFRVAYSKVTAIKV